MNLKNALIVFILVSANITTLSLIDLKDQEIPEIKNKNEEVAFSADPLLGEVILFGGNFAPRGWAFCDGQLLPISSYSALFSILGITYGGDGRTTFALPDLRGRAAVGTGHGPGLSSIQLGEKSGNEQTYLNLLNMPSHNHSGTAQLKLGDGLATTSNGEGNNFAVNTGTTPIYTDNAATTTNTAENVTVTIGNAGSNQGFSNLQPYLGMNYIIAIEGVYPSRG